MRNIKIFTLSKFCFVLVATIVLMAHSVRPSSAAPQSYVLSFSWQSAFCSKVSGKKKECMTLKSTAYEAQHLSLHGVWPKSQYCDVPAEQIHLDKARRWEQLPAVQLSKQLRTRLDRTMPGTASALERHEWVKHGSCSGVNAEVYFQKGVDLTDAMNRSAVGLFLNKKIGKRVTLSELQAQITSSFGAVPERAIEFLCQTNSRNLTQSGHPSTGDKLKSFFGLNQKSAKNSEINSGISSGQALIELRAFVRAKDFKDIALDAQHLIPNPARNPSRAACNDGDITILEQF